jgi:hypothetical protein
MELLHISLIDDEHSSNGNNSNNKNNAEISSIQQLPLSRLLCCFLFLLLALLNNEIMIMGTKAK